MNKFINLFLDISPSLTIAHYGFLPRTSCLNGLFMENEYIHIIFDDHELHALWSLGTRYALESSDIRTNYVVMTINTICTTTHEGRANEYGSIN